jgi:hypothetical protein
MEYILCEFDFGYSGFFYQEINDGFVIRMTDLDGNTLNLPSSDDPAYIPYGSRVVDPNPPRPSWAQ